MNTEQRLEGACAEIQQRLERLAQDLMSRLDACEKLSDAMDMNRAILTQLLDALTALNKLRSEEIKAGLQFREALSLHRLKAIGLVAGSGGIGVVIWEALKIALSK